MTGQILPNDTLFGSKFRNLYAQRNGYWPVWLLGLVACAPELTLRGRQSLILEEGTGQKVRATGWVLLANDADTPLEQIVWSVSDSRFELTGSGAERMLVVKPGAKFDFESEGAVLEVAVSVWDGVTAATQFVPMQLTDVNEAPQFTSPAHQFFAANAQAGDILYQAAATDPDSNPNWSAISYSLKQTGDHALVSIDALSGAIRLLADAQKSSYSLVVQASDGQNTTELMLELQADIRVYERHPLHKQVWADSADLGSYSLATGRLDNDQFSVTADGRLWFRAQPDFENPTDADKDNRDLVEISRVGTDGTSLIQLEIGVEDIVRETGRTSRFGQPSPEFQPYSQRFYRDWIDAEDRPASKTQHIVSGEIYVMPLSGPLQLIWGIDTSDPDDNLNIQSQLDRFRAELELSIAEYEKAVNVEFIEIHYDGTQSAPWTYDFIVQGGLTGTPGWFAFFPNDLREKLVFVPLPWSTTKPNQGERLGIHTHEIGHVMGLKHPFGGVGVDYDYGWPINNALNSDPYSMMSYAPRSSQHLKAADIEALRFLYGQPGGDWSDSLEGRVGSAKMLMPKLDFVRRIEVAENHDITAKLPDIDWSAMRDSWLADNDGSSFVAGSLDFEKWAGKLVWIGERDNHLFSLDADTGDIWLRQQLDFEAPVDTLHDPKYGGNNIYELLVRETFQISANNIIADVQLDLLIEVEITDILEIA